MVAKQCCVVDTQNVWERLGHRGRNCAAGDGGAHGRDAAAERRCRRGGVRPARLSPHLRRQRPHRSRE